MNKARELLRSVTQDEKSAKQDDAWVYLVRCDYIEDKFADAVKTAQEAFAFWDSPEAKKQAEEFSTASANGATREGRRPYWMARSHTEAKKPQEAIAALAGLARAVSRSSTSPYPELGYDLLVQANLAPARSRPRTRSTAPSSGPSPEYKRLGQITFLLADHYNEQRSVIQEKLRDVTQQLNTARDRQARGREGDPAPRLAPRGPEGRFRKDQARSSTTGRSRPGRGHAGARAKRDQGRRPGGRGREQGSSRANRIPKIEDGLKEWAPKRDKLTAEVETLFTQKDALEQELYEPLTKAAGYYKEWDDALKRAGQRRDPDNVGVFAQLFWSAGRLRPEVVAELGERAGALYEDYFGFKTITEKPKTDPEIVGRDRPARRRLREPRRAREGSGEAPRAGDARRRQAAELAGQRPAGQPDRRRHAQPTRSWS